jgi:hypothetical protein
MIFKRTAPAVLALLLLTACHTTAPPPKPTAQNSHAWLEISEPAFEQNLAEMKKLVGPHTQVCAVIERRTSNCRLLVPIPFHRPRTAG